MVSLAKRFFSYKKVETPYWGMSTLVDCHNCDPKLITSREHINQYVLDLCDKIDMKRYGNCQIFKFGTGNKEGYSMFQLIETSNISGHFANTENKAFVDIFSCKEYDPKLVAEFTKDYFGSTRYTHYTTKRY